MPKLFDLVKVNTATTGTGTITFGPAFSNSFLTPSEAGCVDSDSVRYVLVDGDDIEVGEGVIGGSVTTMTRTVVFSKIGGTKGTSKISLSGTAFVYFTALSSDILNPSNNLSDVVNTDTAADNIGAYRRGTILGTVSQSGGVPTGAIIESGSNANGNYVKYADGTMICWGTKAAPTISAWSGSGTTFYSQLSSFSFPATFASTPTGHLTFSDNSVSGRAARLGAFNFSTTGVNTIYLVTTVSGASTTSTGSNLYFMAFGRWF